MTRFQLPPVQTYGAGALLALLVVLVSACVDDGHERTTSESLVSVGDAIPDFVLTAADGTELSSASLGGRAYILNFFDTRCPDCQEELQVLQQVYDRYGPAVPLLNVPRSQTRQEVDDYWQQAGLSMPFYTPVNAGLYYRFARSGVPRTYVVGSEGTVQAAFADSPVAALDSLDALLCRLAPVVRLSMRVRVGAVRDGIDDYYFHNEYTVSRLDVYLFDADTKAFYTKATISNLTEAETLYDTEYDITYVFENIRLLAGRYDIFAIANYDQAPDGADREEQFLDIVDDVTYQDGIKANIPDTGPVMTSRPTALLDVDLVPWINKEYMLNVELERVMAKMQIGVSHNTFPLLHNQRKYADINITNYKMVNLNRSYYLFLHRDSLPEFSSRTAFEMPYNYSDYTDQGDQYVIDPLFYQKTTNPQDAARFGNYYMSWFGAFTTGDFASMPSADNYGYAYVLENTSFSSAQKNGYSPGIVFKAAVSPVFVYLYDSRQRTLEQEYRPEYWPNTIYLYKYNFYESIQAVNVAGGLSLDELATYTDTQLKAHGIKQCKFNMGVYETYYTYWIRHRNSPDHPMGPMQYGIVRNNFYRMVITGITGIGNSTVTPDMMRDNYPNSYEDVEMLNQ